MPTDVVVVGGGPAGSAVARAAVRHGLTAVVVDPAPHAPWPATYGAWADELPASFPADVIGARLSPAPVVTGSGERLALPREYVMLSTSALRAHLVDPAVPRVAGSVVALNTTGGRTAVVTADGQRIRGRVVIDTSGAARTLTGGPAPEPAARQTAYGVVVPASDADELAFMDWRADHGHRGWPTFLYAVPLAGGQVLLEETALARRPALPIAALRRRLRHRLAARGIELDPAAPTERVTITVDTPVTTGRGPVVPFGAAAPLVHPATGYSLAASLRLAAPMAEALAAHLAGASPDPLDAAAAAREVVWSRGARVVHHLRRRGLEATLALPPEGVAAFFEVFFHLPIEHQRAYLSNRDDPVAVMAAMAAVFRAADRPLRRHLVRWGGAPWGAAPLAMAP